jgi:hypothetical protein
MWFWTAFWGLAGTGVGVYFSYQHGRVALVVITVGAAAAGLVVALLTALGALWATAPVRSLGEDVRALSASVAELQRREENRPEPLRVALMAVRSELGACATIITEARTKKEWWRPHDQLPGTQWRDHFAALADPALSRELHAQINLAYQSCHRLNQRINGYVAAHKASQYIPFPVGPPATVFQFREGDEEALRDAIKKIEAANYAISTRVDEGQA